MYFWTQKSEVSCLWPTSLFSLFTNQLSSSFPFIALSSQLPLSSHLPFHSTMQLWSVITWKQPGSLSLSLSLTLCVCICCVWERDKLAQRSANETTPENISHTQCDTKLLHFCKYFLCPYKFWIILDQKRNFSLQGSTQLKTFQDYWINKMATKCP